MDFDISTELLVVGAGLAGLTAANRALDLGRSAIVVETSDNPKNLCASRLSGGLFHVAYRSVLAPPEELVRKTMAATQGHVDTKLAQALAGNAARGVQWLKSKGIEFTSIEPDQGWRDHVAAPLGFYDQSHFVWEGLGADVLLNTLERRFLERGGRIIRDTRVFELAVKEGRVAGVIAINSVARIRLQAGAVVLADGGFQGNVEMLAQYVTPHPHKLKLRGPAAGRGDGIRMARELGAALVGMPYFYGHVLSADALHNDKLCPFPFVDFLAAAGMLVDDQAQRFVDESKAGVFMANAMARHGDGTATVIFDEPIWNEAGRVFFCPPNPNLVQGGGTLHKAQSLEELARLAGLDAKLLVASVQQRNNELVAGKLNSSLDERGALKYQPVYIGQPPFYAAPACACITHTTGGLKVDASARVLHEAGHPIRGLYVAGSTAGGLEGGPQAGYVGGLVKALVFGLLAAESFVSDL
jgi:fumarate reductase flavoprotein subunit